MAQLPYEFGVTTMLKCRRRILTRAMLVGVVLATTGCHAVPHRASASVPARTKTAISRLEVLWSEGVVRQDNRPVVQGFVGKVYLFGADSAAPVTAPGKFTIYAYDDTRAADAKADKANIKPDRTWELDESDLRDLLKKDAVGWSYSLWLPAVEPVPTERRYSLIVCFTSEQGSRVLSESTLVTLPAIRGLRSPSTSQTLATKTAAAEKSSHVTLANSLLTP